ncbi:AfsR family transcriptional regulator [Amycolatopsis antarctica]|uniref:AfsR family transcriptional regulator n=1 Tax=Amycolatopsis antarctica TaxID=1854586 RepID=A0A263D0W3_9PSEU|nr:BTAD domain-containing putative transcriptional regulator [Amycolatopsis antarctica]OZM71277.1 AfsR family transcriptional regulator [Amycolatopsis antarctica]
MQFGVLGPVEVITDRGVRVRVPELKVRLLLAHLLLHAGHAVTVDALVDRLWGERTPVDPKASLQAKVSQLRRVLADAESGGRELVVSEPGGYRIGVTEQALDSGRFAELLERVRSEPDAHERAALLDDAMALWRGPAFVEVADELTAQPVLARLNELWLSAAESRAEALLDLGEHLLLTGELDELAERHPLRERLRAAQMRALYLAGRPNEALAAFEDLRTRLRDELGADPAPELVELHQAVLRHGPELRTRPREPAVRSPLPTPATELIGREADLERVRALLDEDRLVSLVGIGGVGKTRLALAVAHEYDRRHEAGVRLVELDALPAGTAAESVADLVCRAFGRQAGASAGQAADTASDAKSRLLATVRGFTGLLVLDNCEHLLEAVAELVLATLAAAPELTVLATSREPLELSGEVLHPVEPLPTTGTASAVRLFTARASAVDPAFVLDERTEPLVRTICARLDGIPLALELAAARVRTLGVAGVAERLDDRLALLSGRRRDAPVRQRTLRATIDWSWELLTATEQTVLRRLSVFSGGCGLAAAEEVCGGSPATDVLDTVTRLVDRSLLVRNADGRYRLLEAVAEYAAERLAESGEAGELHRRFVAHCLALAERAAPRLRGREQRTWLTRLDEESANLGAALCRMDDADEGLRLVDALAWYWFLRGRPGQMSDAAELVLALPGGDPRLRASVRVWRAGMTAWADRNSELAPDGVAALAELGEGTTSQARARWFLAFACWGFGDMRVVTDWAGTALRTCRQNGDQWGCAAALATGATYAALRDELPAARRDAGEAERLFTALGDRWGRLQALDTLALVAEVTGDYPEAARLQANGLRIAEDLRLGPEVAGRLSGLGRVTMLTGDLGTARAQHERARKLAADQGNAALVGYAEFGLALTARRTGDLATAERLLLPWTAEEVASFATLTPFAELGFIAELRGDGRRALELHEAGYHRARAAGGGRRTIALALEGLAGAWSLLGEPERAAGLLGAADAARQAVGAPLPAAERLDVDRISERLRTALGERAFEESFAAGADRLPAELVGTG